MAASDARNTAAAINAAVASAGHRYPSPQQRRWKGYWARYWCFKFQKKREKRRIVPASRSEAATGPVPHGWTAAGHASLGLAPPSSPASFINSSSQSPASFTLSLSAVSASIFSPGPPNTMFTIGPYAHETQLVSPPVFSTFTTEPSTAPFTPPPELAHLTTPSSPDVPFAQYIASSLAAKKAAARDFSPLSTSTIASPCETPMCYTPTSGHLYLGSPLGRLILPSFVCTSWDVAPDDKAVSVQTASFPSMDDKKTVCGGQTAPFPSFDERAVRAQTASFPSFDPFAGPSLDQLPFAALILPCETTVDQDSPLEGCGCTSSDHVLEDFSEPSGITDESMKYETEMDANRMERGCCESVPSELSREDDIQECGDSQQSSSANGVGACDCKNARAGNPDGSCNNDNKFLLPEDNKNIPTRIDLPVLNEYDAREMEETVMILSAKADEHNHEDIPAKAAVHVSNEICAMKLEETGGGLSPETDGHSHVEIPVKATHNVSNEIEASKLEETGAGLCPMTDEHVHMDVPVKTSHHVSNDIDAIKLEDTGAGLSLEGDGYSHTDIPAKAALHAINRIDWMKMDETATGHLGQTSTVALVEA